MSAQGNPPATKDSDVDIGKPIEADAVDSLELEEEEDELHSQTWSDDAYDYPYASHPEEFEDPLDADYCNAAVLELRGYRSGLTGVALWELACKVEDNSLYDEDEEENENEGDEDDMMFEGAWNADDYAAYDALLSIAVDQGIDAYEDLDGPSAEEYSAAMAEARRYAAREINEGKAEEKKYEKMLHYSATDRQYELVFEKPLYFFFYGTLQDESQLRRVCELDSQSTPRLRPASIRGWRVKMWGPFPALVPGEPDDRVDGMVWRCDEGHHVIELCEYESEKYGLTYCDIYVEDKATKKEGEEGEEEKGGGSEEKAEKGKERSEDGGVEIIHDGRVFVLAADADDETLKEGSFDMEHWRKLRHT